MLERPDGSRYTHNNSISEEKWERFKPEIIRIYKDENATLTTVERKMEKLHSRFKAKHVPSLRAHFNYVFSCR